MWQLIFRMQYPSKLCRLFILNLALTSCLSTAATRTESEYWIQVSWLNVYSQASTKSESISQLPLNTKVIRITEILAPDSQDSWCEISFSSEDDQASKGFVPCNSLATQAVTHSDDPMAQFWLHPTIPNFIKAGNYLAATLDPNDDSVDVNNETHSRPPVAEFEVMKKRLMQWTTPTDNNYKLPASISNLSQIKDYESESIIKKLLGNNSLPNIKSSLFTKNVNWIFNLGDSDYLPALIGNPFRVTEFQPVLVDDSYGLLGYWDTGDIIGELQQPLYRHTLNTQGLLSLEKATVFRLGSLHEDPCETSNSSSMYFENLEPLPNYPIANNSLFVEFFSKKPLKFTSVNVISRHEKITLSGEDSSSRLITEEHPILIHEIDIDKDGVIDLVIWEGQSELANWQISFANISGAWYIIAVKEYHECT